MAFYGLFLEHTYLLLLIVPYFQETRITPYHQVRPENNKLGRSIRNTLRSVSQFICFLLWSIVAKRMLNPFLNDQTFHLVGYKNILTLLRLGPSLMQWVHLTLQYMMP